MYSEHHKKVNEAAESSLLSAAVAALRDLGLKVTAGALRRGHAAGDDATLTLQWDGGEPLRYSAEIRPAVGPALLGHVAIGFGEDKEGRVLVTDYVTPPMADKLRLLDIQFIDAAGNAFLKGNGLLVFVSGRRPRVRRTAGKTLRVFRPSGLRTIFALLSVPELVGAPQREIARAAGVALGSVAHVLNGLRELGFIAETSGTRRLLHRERLTHQWTEAYVRSFEPTLGLGRFSAPAANWWRRADLNRSGAQWGGETAAAVLQRHIIPELAILYSTEIPRRLLSRQHLKADPEGNVVVRRRFWSFETATPRLDVVPPLLVYADLVAAGDARSLAAAEQIRDAYLA
jgi:hypothetical protein